MLTVGSLLKEQSDQLKLELVTGEKSLERRIKVSELNRPGLALIGFSEGFRAERIQIIGVGEQAYCLKAPSRELTDSLAAMRKTEFLTTCTSAPVDRKRLRSSVKCPTFKPR